MQEMCCSKTNAVIVRGARRGNAGTAEHWPMGPHGPQQGSIPDPMLCAWPERYAGAGAGMHAPNKISPFSCAGT